MVAQYDGDVAFGDHEFGRFVRELKALGLYDDALVLFMADHGEEFLDHGRWLHGRSLFDELIRIPLVLKLPGGRGRGARIERQVQGVDVMPTLLEAMGAPLPPDLVGRPLQRALENGEPARPALAEISHRGFVAHGVRTEEEKFVRRFSPDDDELLFDRAGPGREDQHRRRGETRVVLRKAQVAAWRRTRSARAARARRRQAALRSRPTAGSRRSRPPPPAAGAPVAATGARSTWCCSRARERRARSASRCGRSGRR
jgi:hypothetical protein